MAMVQIRQRDSRGRFIGQESKVEICPNCGASCNNDVTIADHGECYDCHKVHLNAHRHDDGGVCCECGGAHCCCDCPVFGGEGKFQPSPEQAGQWEDSDG